jgi:2'-5' RNA ligase
MDSDSLYEPFIGDAGELALLQGQRYLVLRVSGPLAAAWEHIAATARTRLTHLPVAYPARGHITLGGTHQGAILDVQAVVRELASATPPLQLKVEGVDFFPPPFQIVILRVRKTPELTDVLTRFRLAARRRGLVPFEHIPPEHWTFHLSVAYCRRLGPDDWRATVEFFEELAVPEAEAVGSSLELVAFDDGREYSGGIYPVGGSRAADA